MAQLIFKSWICFNNILYLLQNFQSSEVPNSSWLEIEGLKRIMKFLLEENTMRIHSFVTDRHTQVTCWIKDTLLGKGIKKHYFDVWHMAKSVFNLLFKFFIKFFSYSYCFVYCMSWSLRCKLFFLHSVSISKHDLGLYH